MNTNHTLSIEYVPIASLRHYEHNPRLVNETTKRSVRESIEKHDICDPLLVNKAAGREGVILGGNLRYEVLKDMGHTEVPVVWLNIPDPERERDLVIRLNKAVGEWDTEILKEFSKEFLADTGFSSEEIDDLFPADENPETFDLAKEMEKIGAENDVKKGDIFDLDGSRLMCGSSLEEADVLALMDGQKADMCCTDPPYLLDYLHGKKKKGGQATEGFGLKRDRKYLGTDSLPENFTDIWMANIAKIQKPDFSIIVFENPKNLKTIWLALEQHWKYRNTITWHVPNRVQGFAAKYKFFNKTDVAIVGTGGEVAVNLDTEEPLFEEEYENAIYATSGKPHFEGYEKGKKICPTDFIEHIAADEKSSGQSIIFGTKPIELLIPYIKVLTKRGDLIIEPYGGSGSTLVAAVKLGRRCFVMEKAPEYTAVIRKRWEVLTGKKAVKLNG